MVDESKGLSEWYTILSMFVALTLSKPLQGIRTLIQQVLIVVGLTGF